jgi:hypothetical protein
MSCDYGTPMRNTEGNTLKDKKERTGNTARHETWPSIGVMMLVFLNFVMYGS